MTTLKERFEKEFTPELLMELASRYKYGDAMYQFLSFFRQELLALADSVAGMVELTVPDRDRVEEFIRAKADELANK